jgi:hypothetical protein
MHMSCGEHEANLDATSLSGKTALAVARYGKGAFSERLQTERKHDKQSALTG